MRQSLCPVPNAPSQDVKRAPVSSFQARPARCTPAQPIEIDDESEYSDPEIADDDDSYDDEYDELPPVDKRNLGKPAKLAKYAEAIFSIAREDISNISISSEKFRSIQAEITPAMHETAVSWILTIQQNYLMANDTIYEAVTYLDTVLSKSPIRKTQLQLVTVTCVWMAAKIEERSVPKLEELSFICSNQYKVDDFIKCERKLLRILDFRLSFPTSKFFLRRLLDSIDAEQNVIDVANFFCDLALIPLCFLDFSPIVIALAAVCLGKICLNEYCPSLRLMAHAHIDNIEESKKCGMLMLNYAPTILTDQKHILHIRYNNPLTTQSVFKMKIDFNLSEVL